MKRFALAPLTALAVSAALAGCGGGSDSTSTATSGQAQPQTATTTGSTDKSPKQGEAAKGQGSKSGEEGKSTFTPKPHHDSGGGSEQFRVKGGDNSIQEFGEEADSSEFDEAAAALHGFLDARAQEDWEAACSYLAAPVAKSLLQLGASAKELKGADCGELLAALSKGVPASTLAEAAQADVGSLRFDGEQAFVIYRGAQDAIYALTMKKEGGEWKVGGLSGTPIG
jgi:hypothetical protein